MKMSPLAQASVFFFRNQLGRRRSTGRRQ
jgi:hypothetical protein